MTHTIELKGVKRAAFASHETDCFEATVYVDGKRFCHVSNDGHGGCNDYHLLKGEKGRGELYNRIEDIGAAINPNAVKGWDEARDVRIDHPPYDAPSEAWDQHFRTSAGITRHNVFDHFVNRALSRALALKEMKTRMRNRWLFKDGKDGKIYAFAKRAGDHLDKAQRYAASLGEGNVLLNAMDEAKALEIWMAS